MNVIIQDTGYLTTSLSGTQEKDIVNSGNQITLYNTTMSYSLKNNVDVNPEINNYRVVVGDSTNDSLLRQLELPTTQSISVESPKIIITGSINTEAMSKEEMGLELIGVLNRLVKTKGLKKVFYEPLKYLCYEEEGVSDYILVRFTSFSLAQNAVNYNILKFTLEGVVEQDHD